MNRGVKVQEPSLFKKLQFLSIYSCARARVFLRSPLDLLLKYFLFLEDQVASCEHLLHQTIFILWQRDSLSAITLTKQRKEKHNLRISNLWHPAGIESCKVSTSGTYFSWRCCYYSGAFWFFFSRIIWNLIRSLYCVLGGLVIHYTTIRIVKRNKSELRKEPWAKFNTIKNESRI